MDQKTIQPRPEYLARYEVQVTATPGGAWRTVETFDDLARAQQAAARNLHDDAAPGVAVT